MILLVFYLFSYVNALNWHLFWPGISTPAYTPEALAEYNAPKIPWQGQLLTEEQARQKQRALERQIRRAKRECIVAEEWGIPSEESAAKARLVRARARLNAYLEETGLKMDEGRTEVAKVAAPKKHVHRAGIPQGSARQPRRFYSSPSGHRLYHSFQAN